ncbi:MAG: CBS domain-containing protein [Haloarculaceae archaeon]
MNGDVTVREVMDREFVGVNESDDLVGTVELMLREQAEAALVLRGSEPIGLMSERDVLALLVDGPAPDEATVGDAMTESVPTVDATAPLPEAADRMATRADRRVVVTEPASVEPLGVLTTQDLLETAAYRTEDEGPTTGTAGDVGSPGADLDRGAGEADRAVAARADQDGRGMEASAGFQDQGICERCETLTGELASINGQLLCADCRTI